MSEAIMEGWVTLTEASGIAGYSSVYVGRLARKGRIQAHRVGRRGWLVNLTSLLAYKSAMNALGTAKHNPWRSDLTANGKGRAA